MTDFRREPTVRPRALRVLLSLAAALGLSWGGALYAQDADGDRLTDATENFLGTNPALADTDGDGDDDRLEYYRCRSPLDAADRGATRCKISAGNQPPDWVWSESGPVAGMRCIRITNVVAPAQWPNTHICSTAYTGWRWSTTGPIASAICMAWKDTSDPAWNNDLHYLCGLSEVPFRFPIDFSFVAGTLQQTASACLRLTNALAPATWQDNYLCHRDDRALIETVGCVNCASSDLAAGPVLAFTGSRTTGGAVTVIPQLPTVDGQACTAVPGQPLQCRLPAGSFGDLGSGRLGATFPQRFSVDFPAPEVSTITPANLPANGGTLTLDGTYFGIDAATVTVAGQPCGLQSRTPTRIVCTAPPRPAGIAPVTVPVVVSVGNQRTAGVQVGYRAPPTVKGIGVVGAAPTAGGGRVVVLGTDLDTSPVVSVDNTLCDPQSSEADVLVCRMPPGRGTGRVVRVLVAGYEFLGSVDYDPPVVSGVSGMGGPTRGGTLVTIDGRNFGATAAGVLPRIDGQACLVSGPNTQITHTRIVCVLPEGQGNGVPVAVNVLGRDSNALTYSYAVPVVEPLGSLRLRTAGNELLELRGSNLGTRGSVRIAGAPCTFDGPATTHGHELIRCRTPEGLGVDQPVTVDISGNVASTLVSFRVPTLSGGQLGAGPTIGGNEIVLEGSDLGGAALTLPRSIVLGTTECELLEASHTTLRCRVPAGQGRNLPLLAVVGGQPSNALAYSYLAPLITEVTPGTLPLDGQILLTVSGQNFGVDPQATVGGLGCQRSGPAGHGQLRCIAPPAAAGPAVVQLAAGNQASNAWIVQYALNPVMVALHKAGDGFGQIGSTPAGLACDATCTARENLFPRSTAITLTVQPEPGSTFLGWEGPCSGTGATCSFTANDDTAVGVSFSSPLFGSGFEGD